LQYDNHLCDSALNYYQFLFLLWVRIAQYRYSDLLETGCPGIESRWGRDCIAHPASYTMGSGSFPGVEWLMRVIYHPPHLVPRLKKE